MSEQPLISIIIPTFNVVDKIEQSLRSVLAMEGALEPVEVLVMDGNSTDDTVPLARAWATRDARVKVHSEADNGVYDAMNKGIAQSKGQFLLFLGAGDELKSGVLSQIIPILHQHISANTAPLFLYGDVWWQSLGRRYDGVFSQWKMTQRPPCHQAIFYQRTIFERLGNYSLRYPINADFALNILIFGSTTIEKRYVDLVICDYEGGGISSHTRDEAFLEDLPQLVRQNFSPLVRILYRLRRSSPKSLKKLGAPLMRLMKWSPDKKMRTQMPD